LVARISSLEKVAISAEPANQGIVHPERNEDRGIVGGPLAGVNSSTHHAGNSGTTRAAGLFAAHSRHFPVLFSSLFCGQNSLFDPVGNFDRK